MRVHLKHVKSVTKRLASGERVAYHYHRRTGARIFGEPGTAQFLESYKAASQAKGIVRTDTLAGLLTAFQASGDFAEALKPRTQSDYRKHIEKISKRFGSMPVAVLEDRRVRKDFMVWRDQLARSSAKQSDYTITVLARVLSWAMDQYLVESNHASGIRKLYRSDRRESIWTPDQFQAALKQAHETVANALLMAYDTGQRQGDLLALSWNAYDGEGLTIKQGKTSRVVYVPCTALLKARLDRMERRATTILTNRSGRPWTSDGFRTMFDRAKKKAGVKGRTFHDLRGTFITRLAEAGATDAEINAITGHSDGSMLQTAYLARTKKLAWSAIAKLEAGTGTKLTTKVTTAPVDKTAPNVKILESKG